MYKYKNIPEGLEVNHVKTIVEECFIDCGHEYDKPYVYSTINSVTKVISKIYEQTDDNLNHLLSNFLIILWIVICVIMMYGKSLCNQKQKVFGNTGYTLLRSDHPLVILKHLVKQLHQLNGL